MVFEVHAKINSVTSLSLNVAPAQADVSLLVLVHTQYGVISYFWDLSIFYRDLLLRLFMGLAKEVLVLVLLST